MAQALWSCWRFRFQLDHGTRARATPELVGIAPLGATGYIQIDAVSRQENKRQVRVLSGCSRDWPSPDYAECECCYLKATMHPRWCQVLGWLLLLAMFGAVRGLVQVPNRHTVASMPGDLVLGVLVPVHERPSPKQAQTRTCGTVREQYGIQRVETAMRTIDSINADPNILPNITLGLEIRDSCWFSPIALEQSIEFIRDAMAASEQTQQQSKTLPSASLVPVASGLHQLQAVETNSSLHATCAPLLAQQKGMSSIKKVKNIVGVVGPASSTDTVQVSLDLLAGFDLRLAQFTNSRTFSTQVQNLLQLFNMPQVGYSATSRDLSNKNFFKYFLRVVPADKLQAQVMIDLMLAHNWTYITVTYTEGKSKLVSKGGVALAKGPLG